MIALLALLPTLALAVPTVQKRYSGVYIQANRDDLCLSVSGGMHAAFAAGVAVVSLDCSQATTWDLNPGSGSILAHNVPQFAIDAGSNPGNNGALKLWDSYPGLYQQTWYLTNDQRIAITGGTQCMDEGDNGIQTYQCTTGNTNQIFNILTSPPGTSSSSASVTSSTSSTPVTSSTSSASSAPTGSAKRFHPNGNANQCLSVMNGYAGIGSAVEITDCFSDNDPFAPLQLWTAPAQGSTGSVSITADSNTLCLDAGSSPANGGAMKVWTCYSGLLQQTWTYSSANVLSLSDGQCLDVVAGSTPQEENPYESLQNVQTWACSNNGDPQQIFTQ